MSVLFKGRLRQVQRPAIRLHRTQNDGSGSKSSVRPVRSDTRFGPGTTV